MADGLRALIAGTVHSIHVHQLPEQLFAKLPSTELFSKAIYYRLLAPYLLEREATILYLDADIVCLNAFTDFYNSRSAYTDIALVVSEGEHLAPTLAANIGLQGSNYFNSGMLLINVQRWLQENISDKTISILESQGHKFKYMNQDALNIILEGKVRFVEKNTTLYLCLATKKPTIKSCHPLTPYFCTMQVQISRGKNGTSRQAPSFIRIFILILHGHPIILISLKMMDRQRRCIS